MWLTSPPELDGTRTARSNMAQAHLTQNLLVILMAHMRFF
jgi:hypothetical protein